MAYLLTNVCTNNYLNPTIIVAIIIRGWVIYFLRHFETQYTFPHSYSPSDTVW